ncbi:MAG: dynamin family protein [Desulfobacteraceae bacterium]|nr:dynamin family protein [Desulfobacteraceae bacterium]
MKDKILMVNQDVLRLFSTAKSIPGMADFTFGEWEKTCESLPGQLAENTIRVAIVGTIKSGKSTFLNSIFKGEYVKRGAGVITSIVTRVRNADRLRAKLFFKSWDEVNAEMEQALVLFPSANWLAEDGRFDIRQKKEREKLQQALSELSTEQLISRSTRNINNVLLTSYLKGYENVSGFLTSETGIQLYEDKRFSDHKTFVGNESLAVYLKDVLLEIKSDNLQSNIEIADCQGSDSSNPLHLTMIQDYLLMTHLIVYVISSRTGLRQADIRFLSMIKKMGIMDNMMFVVNCDFSEHDSLDDLQNLIGRIREEIAMIKPNPDVYCFSALYNLFSSLEDNLSDKDRQRYDYWKADRELIDFSNSDRARFESVFNERLARKRYTLLLRNHIERLGVILSGIGDWVGLNRNVLTNDADKAVEILQKIETHQQRLNQLKSSIKKTLSGAVPEIRKELQREVNLFLDAQSGPVAKDLRNFIRAYTPAFDKYQSNIEEVDFSRHLYLLFQDFKQGLDAHITEVINPEVLRFVHDREKRIEAYFEALIMPFESMVEDAYEEFNGLLGRSASNPAAKKRLGKAGSKMESVIKNSGTSPPPIVAALNYSAKVRTEAVMRLGLYRALRNVKTLFRKSSAPKGQEALKALKDASRRIKRETEKTVVFNLKDYRENLKFRFLFKLVDATAEGFAQAVLDRFQAYFSDLSVTIEGIGTNQKNKTRAIKILDDMDQVCRELDARIGKVREEIEQAS